MTEKEKEPKGRVVVSRGPIIRALQVVSFLTSIFATAAFVFAYIAFDHGLRDQRHTIYLIQQSRGASATSTCFLIREVVIVSAAATHRVAAAAALIDSTPLRDCVDYGRTVTKIQGGAGK